MIAGLDLIAALVARFLPGIDLAAVERMALQDARDFLRGELIAHWNRRAAAIVAQLKADGWDYNRVTADRPSVPDAYVGDITYRLVRDLLHHGGWVIDFIRDLSAPAVLAVVRPQISATTGADHNVRATINALAGIWLPAAGKPPLAGITGGPGAVGSTAPAPTGTQPAPPA